MSAWTALLEQPAVLRLGTALVHFLWQGAALAIVAMLVLAVMRRRSAQTRYVVALVLFGAMALCPIATVLAWRGDATSPDGTKPGPVVPAQLPPTAHDPSIPLDPSSSATAASPSVPAWETRPIQGTLLIDPRTNGDHHRFSLTGAREWLNRHLVWIVAFWLAGVTLLSLRLLVGWAGVVWMRRRGVQAVDEACMNVVRRLTVRLGIRRPVRVLQSALAEVPTVLGWLKPVVLLPASALTGLSPAQLEAILAHELAHVRRHDYLVNVLQTVVETLLFYHPAVWWLSRRIRREREHCCDDLAVAVCGDRLLYARALATLEASRIPQPALAATGGPLLSRIRRVVGSPVPSHVRPWWPAAALSIGAIVALTVAIRLSGTSNAAPTTPAQQEDKPAGADAVGIDLYELRIAGNGDTANSPEDLVAVFGDSHLRHWGTVSSVAFSPDASMVASASSDHTVGLWDARTGELLRSLKHPDSVYAVAFDPRSHRLASAGRDRTIRLWDSRTGELVRKLEGHEHECYSLAFSPDGSLLATGAGDSRDEHAELILWSVATGDPLRRLEGHSGIVRSLAFSPNGRTLLSSGGRYANPVLPGEVKLWNIADGRELRSFEGHRGPVYAIALSPDGRTVASGGYDHTMRIWDTETGEQRHVIGAHPTAFGVHVLAFAPDGKTVASGGGREGVIRFWDIATGELQKTLKGHASGVGALAFNSDGSRLISASDAALRLWDMGSGKELLKLEGLTNGFDCLEFSPDGKTLATGGGLNGEGAIALFDVQTRKRRGTLIGHTRTVHRLAFSPDGKTLASGGWDEGDGSAIIWDLDEGQPRHILRGFADGLVAVAFSPDGQTLATGSYNDDQTGSVKLWDVFSGGLLENIDDGEDRAWSVSFSPDGQTLAWGNWSNDAYLLSMTGGQRRRLAGHEHMVMSVAFSRDGNTLATAGQDEIVKLWDTSRAELLQTFTGANRSAVFSPDGKLVAASGPGKVRVWNVQNGKLVREWSLGPAGAYIPQVAFSPDGRYLATANWNGTAYLLKVPSTQADPPADER